MLLSIRSLFPLGLLAMMGVWFALPVFQKSENNFFSFLPAQEKELSKKALDSLPTREDKRLMMPLDTPKPYRAFRLPFYQSPQRYQDYFSQGAGQPTFRFNQFKEDIEYKFGFGSDSLGHYYKVNETYGGKFYRNPFVYDQQTFQEIQKGYNERQNWRELAGGKKTETALTGKDLRLKIPAEAPWFERLFGEGGAEFTPVGFVNLDFGIQNQRTANPNLPLRQQRMTTFNFDPHANISVSGKVGSKLRMSGSFDTKASFGFENAFKVDYQGNEEDIIRDIDLGNVTFTLPTTLIQGGQNLMGISTELQFGRLKVRSVLSQQRSRAETISLRGGAQRRSFSISCGEYEDNRHFFLSQYFRNNYEFWLSAMPQLISGLQITRLEVYVINRVNNTQDIRNAVAFLDLGEASPKKQTLNLNPAEKAPRNNANNLPTLTQNTTLNADQISGELTALGFTNGEDYEMMRSCRKLQAREYTFNPQLGYISLLTPLRNDEAIAVAYEYTINGKVFRVGELTDDYAARGQEEVIKLKMLRPKSIRLDLPTWDLMMKNIYSLGATSINKQNFLLRVVYRDDLTGLDNPTLQEGVRTRDQPLLRVMNLDRLNSQNDPQPDGNVDFIDNVTMDTKNGRIIFPVLEPFGSNLVGKSNFNTDTRQLKFDPVAETGLINKYVFTTLYRSTKADALQAADKNKFFLVGSYEGAVGQQVSLPGLNIPPGSVKVTMGGIPLQEGTQYTVDYTTGQVEILDQSLKDKQIDISFEKADLFNFQQRRLFGLRFDYELFKEKDRELMLGATYMSFAERPVITRVNLLEEPVNNKMIGFDINYRAKSRFLTRMIDALPLISTKAESDVTFNGEFAQLFPGASKFSKDISLIDDFEGTRTAFNFSRNPQIGWKLGATPQLFPEATSTGLEYAYRRAKMAWYNVDNIFYRGDAQVPPVTQLENHYVRAIQIQEVYPNRQRQQVQLNETIFDLAYYPEERGQYNYNPDLTSQGLLKNPRNNFAAITRAITSDIDFDNANVEYIEFWLMNPFMQGANGRVLDGRVNQNNTTGADLYINLGNISEDVIPDNKHGFENGMPETGGTAETTETDWGRVTNKQYLNNAFPNNPDARPNQDVGLDGLRSSDEVNFAKFSAFVNAVNTVVTNPDARQRILEDISGDNFDYFLGESKDAAALEILERYKRFNGMDGNTPFSTGVGENAPASSNFPDNEDMNVDNTISNVEGYYQYKIPLRPNQLKVGNGFIISESKNTVNGDEVSWYLFRIPIRTFQEKVGSIDGFKSIRYVRMFVTNAEQPIVLRFSQYQLVANQWRRYLGDLSDRRFGLPLEPYDAKFAVSTVNIEENGDVVGGVTPYVIPPGVVRDRDVTSPIERQLNEQSMQMCVTDLRDRDARAIFRNYSLDFLSYKKLQLFVHAQSDNIANDEMTVFVRLGTDFTDNYYEVELPLKLTPKGTQDPDAIWKSENMFDLPFDELVNTKVLRNQAGQSVIIPFSRFLDKYRITVNGNPDLSAVMTIMIGIRNPDQREWGRQDDKLPKSICIWVNELRAQGFKNDAGWATLARTSIRLADFAQINGALSVTTFGFGAITQRISERFRSTNINFDASATVALDKFFPDKWGIRLPLFVGYEERRILPRFNPLDPDVELRTSLERFGNDGQARREYEQLTIEKTTRRNINFTNVRKVKMNPNRKNHLWDIENFTFTWARNEEKRTDVRTAEYYNLLTKYAVGYTFTRAEAKGIEPFAKSKAKIFTKSYMLWLKDFNFDPLPTSLSVTGDIERSFIKTLYRGADLTTRGVEPLFQKRFLFNRNYALAWNFTKSLNLTYGATANAVIDEPDGEIDSDIKRDSIFTNLKRLGRMKLFNQNLNLTYKVPFDKLPILNWVNADAGYSTKYQWTAGAIGVGGQLGQADTLGNLMGNDRTRSINGGFDLAKLYQKSKLLKWAESKLPPKDKDKNKGKDKEKAKKETDKKPSLEAKKDSLPAPKKEKVRQFIVLKTALKTLLMIRRVTINYTLSEQTVLPGFMKIPRFFGLDSSFSAPGADFALLGSQSSIIKQRAAENGWIAPSRFQNNPFTQNRNETIKLSANVEPLPDLRITVDAQRTRGANYQEMFRQTPIDTVNGVIRTSLQSQNPLRTGTYSISFLSITTAFVNGNAVFTRFVEYRKDIQQRLTAINPNVQAGEGVYADNNPDVLIPAFIAAYSGRDKNKVGLSAFPKIPLPNWQFDYSGLAKLPALKDKVSAFSIRHSYQSSYSVGSYSNSLVYGTDFINLSQSELIYQLPDTSNTEGSFIPVYVVNQVTIQEKFSPLIAITIRTKKNMNITLDYSQDRDISLNLANSQISELRNKSIRFSFGYTKANMKLPFKDSKGKQIVLKNDVDMRVDFTLRDTQGIQRKIDEDPIFTSGNLNVQVRPTINYMVNKQLSVQFYIDRQLNQPRISSSFRRVATNGGIQVRYSIAQ